MIWSVDRLNVDSMVRVPTDQSAPIYVTRFVHKAEQLIRKNECMYVYYKSKPSYIDKDDL